MKKEEFLTILRADLGALPAEDADRSVDYYREMIEDRMEDGMDEEKAVAAVGSVDEAVSQILADVPLSKLVKNRPRKKRDLKPWVIVLLILTAPAWGGVAFGLATAMLGLYIAAWSVLGSLTVAGAAMLPAGVGLIVQGGLLGSDAVYPMLTLIGGGVFCLGLGLLWTVGFVALIRLFVKAHAAVVRALKHRLVKTEVKA